MEYSDSIKEALKEILDITDQKEIEQLSPSEVFETVLTYEGIIGYDDKIKDWITEIYGIDVEEFVQIAGRQF
jgi:hypothetical protein